MRMMFLMPVITVSFAVLITTEVGVNIFPAILLGE
jgi:hypothetical protein